MDGDARGLRAYDRPERAEAYHARGGFDPARKQAMFEAAAGLLTDMVPAGGDVLTAFPK